MENKKEKNMITVFIVVTVIIVLVCGISYAYLDWNQNAKNVTDK